VVTNSLGSATSQVATLTINPNLVQNGGFEAGNLTSWGGNMLGASVLTSPAYVHSGAYGAALGPVGSLGYLSQTLVTTTGLNYLVSLWLDNLGATPNEFQVTWNGNTLFDGLNMAPFGWTNLQFVVTATSASSTLQFGFRQDPSYLGLDDISVTPTNLGPSAAAIVTQPANQTVPVGGSATFSVTATGTAPLSCFWMRNNMLISGANGTSYSTNNVQLSDSGSQFSCLVSNAYGTVLSSNAVLTVFPVIAGLITFDELPSLSSGLLVPVGYHNLSWSNFYYMNGVTYAGPSGYNAGVVSISNIAYNAYGSPASISNSIPFNLISAYLTAVWYDNLQVEAKGYIGTALVYDNTYFLNATSPTLINFGYAGITEVVFISSGGTAHPGYSGGGTHFAVDNMLVVFPALNPTLQMALSGNLLLFFWPVSSPGFFLETSPSLVSATWMPVSDPPIQIGDQYVVPAVLSGPTGFYRLHHP